MKAHDYLTRKFNAIGSLTKFPICYYSGYKTLTPSKVVGPMTVSLTLDEKLSRDVTLHLVNDAALKPAEVTLFNHPESDTVLNITGGLLLTV